MESSADRSGARARVGESRWFKLIVIVAVAALLIGGKHALSGHLLINFTASIPRGVYWISHGVRPQRGDLVAFPIPASVRELLYSRQYVPRSIRILAKPVTAVEGDHVCVCDDKLMVNGHIAGNVLGIDRAGKPVPRYVGCRILPPGEIFVSTGYDKSFDSRHFGPIELPVVRGTLSELVQF